MHDGYRWFSRLMVIAFGVGLVVGAAGARAEKLPVYRLKAPNVEAAARSREVLMPGLAAEKVAARETPTTISYNAGQKRLEIDKRSGLVFMGDMEQLWNPRAKPAVPEAAKAREIADTFLRGSKLLPGQSAAGVRVAFSHVSETAVGDDIPGKVDRRVLDRSVHYRTEVIVKDEKGNERAIPVYGGGGKQKVSVGDAGRVIGYSGGWRDIEGVAAQEEILGKDAAEGEFRKQMGSAKVRTIKSRLAYYAAPAFERQDVLAPVWVVSAELQVGNEIVKSREVVVAATKYGPRFETGPAAKPRGDKEPEPRNNGDEGRQVPMQRSWLDVPVQLIDAFSPRPAYAQANPSECGTSWIGPSQGLGGSPGNKQGFVDQCRAAGWDVIFDWGEAAAFESDWRANDDSWVDNADLVFYTGHASQNGWVLNPPADTFLNTSEANVGSIDLWGNTDNEWIIIAACGPHQSTHFTTNTTNAFDRWRGVFDGLHVFLGYGAVTFDNTDEGRRFMELTRSGWNVIDAWFRTAQEIQPSTNSESAPDGPTIFVTAMYAHNGDHCTRNDHLWGMGSTCPDVVGAGQVRTLMWSGT